MFISFTIAEHQSLVMEKREKDGKEKFHVFIDGTYEVSDPIPTPPHEVP